jgi:hypothetical protein
MPNKYLQPHEDMYTKAFEDRVKEPIEYLQFLAWIKELIRVTEAQNILFNQLYFDLFYIRIVELFEIFNKKNSVSVCTDTYTLHVKHCIEAMYNVMTDDEYICLIYNRHCAAHPLQNGYDLFDPKGTKRDMKKSILIRGQIKQLSVEDVDKALHRVFCLYYNQGMSFEKTILQKLTPNIESLREGWADKANAHLMLMGLNKDSAPYKDLMTF